VDIPLSERFHDLYWCILMFTFHGIYPCYGDISYTFFGISISESNKNQRLYIYQNWYLMVPRNRVNEPQIIENDKFGNW
jgi:hypothetical protein